MCIYAHIYVGRDKHGYLLECVALLTVKYRQVSSVLLEVKYVPCLLHSRAIQSLMIARDQFQLTVLCSICLCHMHFKRLLKKKKNQPTTKTNQTTSKQTNKQKSNKKPQTISPPTTTATIKSRKN